MSFRLPAFLPLVPVALGLVAACSSDDTKSSTPTSNPQAIAGDPAAVLENYAANLYAAYDDAVKDEASFASATEGFLATPTEASLATLRTAWLASREHYMLTESARFYDGPIDIDPPNHEAAVNSWPLDEAYIDYTTNKTTGAIDDSVGFINNASLMATITAENLDAVNAQGGDENISNGWHALEFLLWGQALKDVGPGTRPATDFVVGGPRPNVERRQAYLRAVVAGISTHLTAVRDQWATGAAYRTGFTTAGYASVAKALTGLGKFSKGELASQRINAAYQSKDRRDQHDCFSSETLVDYDRDARGIQAMYLGNYGANDGPGFDTLVAKVNPELDTKIKAALKTSVDAIVAIPKPFESAIVGDDSAAGRQAVRAAINALRAQGDLFAEAATALGLTITVPDEN